MALYVLRTSAAFYEKSIRILESNHLSQFLFAIVLKFTHSRIYFRFLYCRFEIVSEDLIVSITAWEQIIHYLQETDSVCVPFILEERSLFFLTILWPIFLELTLQIFYVSFVNAINKKIVRFAGRIWTSTIFHTSLIFLVISRPISSHSK